jgi:hypothetical protein
MASIVEKITTGLSVSVTNEGSEIVTVSVVKEAISMNSSITQHDTTLTSLIKACRIAIEDKLGASLITRDVVSYWKELYDNENLPYCPVITSASSITVVDSDNVAISSDDYKIRGVGGFLEIVGDFSNGVKLTYSSGYTTPKEAHKRVIVEMVKDVFVNNLSIGDALNKHTKHLSK